MSDKNLPPLPAGASYTPPSLPKGASLESPENRKQTIYTEETIYNPVSGLPLSSPAYGPEAQGGVRTAQKALTTAAGVPINYAMSTAKPVAGVSQLVSKLLGSDLGDEPVRAIQQIEKGVNQNAYSPVTKTASFVGDVANPLSMGIASKATGLAGQIPNMPSYAKAILGGGATGFGVGLTTPEKTGLTPEEFAKEKAKTTAINTAVGGAIPAAIEVAKPIAKYGLGMSTGTGSEAIEQAFKAGKEGNQQFAQNLRKQVPVTDLLESAQGALQTMRNARQSAYQQGIQTTNKNQVFLDFTPITDKLDDTIQSLKVTGVGGVQASKVGPETLNKVNQIRSVVDEWKGKPELHTAQGLDALKQRLDDIYTNDMPSQAKRVLTGLRNEVKQTIVKQDPNYAKTMRDYETALGIERELETALSLGDGKSVQTALNKLQSLGRNNVNTSYDYRKQLADIMRQETGVDLMPAVAGQSMSSWTPRGLQRIMPSLAAGSALAGNPLPLATVPLQSPRVVGELAYGAGKASNLVNDRNRNLARLLTLESINNARENK